MKVLVVGCGSIGERHIRNLKALGTQEIIGCDTDLKRLKVVKKRHQISVSNKLEDALQNQPNAMLVCTPPYLHIPIALKGVKNNTHLFIEKPISHNLNGVDRLICEAESRDLVIMVGYNLRFHPGLRMVKKMLNQGRIGRILSARAEVGQYLPDWRPWQNYRQSYTAKKEMGGGIILDASHELDYLCWLLGEVEEVFCMADKLSHLKVDTEDTAEIILKFKDNIMAEVHLDFVQQGYARSCKIIGEKGTIVWDIPEKIVKVYLAQTNSWKLYKIQSNLNEMYLEEMKHFIKCVNLGQKPLIDGTDGKKTLEVALAAKQSACLKRIISL